MYEPSMLSERETKVGTPPSCFTDLHDTLCGVEQPVHRKSNPECRNTKREACIYNKSRDRDCSTNINIKK